MSGRLFVRVLVTGLVAVLCAASPYFGLPAWTPSLATVVALLSVSLMGLNLIFGNTGMLAFGQAAFVALPGYLAGMLSLHLHVPTLAAIALALIATVIVANLVGRIFIRLPGIFFAVGTLGFAFVVEGLARAFPSVTGGASGLVFSEGTQLSGDAWYALALGTLALALASYLGLVRHRYARTLRVVHHDELAAAVVGIDVARVKSRAFTLGCAYSALGGVLLAYFVGVVVPENSGVNRSLEMVGMVMLGGPGRVLGPLLGAGLVQWMFTVAGFAKQYEVLLYGVAFLGTVLFAREGLGGLLQAVWHRIGSAGKLPPQVVDRSSEPAMPLTVGAPGGVALRVEGVAKRFGGVHAIDDVSFEVQHGEVFALVGPNGAGKTTLFNIISGLEMPSAGRVFVEGQDVTSAPVHERAAGIGRSFQVARLVPDLTTAENVMARLDHIAPHMPEAGKRAAALALLGRFGLGELANSRAAQLSAGQRKLVDIARAALGSPSLLLLDEPAVGLTEVELDQLAGLLDKLKQQRCGIVLVEHNIGFLSRVAASGVVLHGGIVIARGPIGAMLQDEAVRNAYLGAIE
ncbi:ATP-binding cassette domain-containing protein [Variovorax terrae]|uniref:Branched-chain amino acid ABC transporter ATP-binding protein/permease n=1 Tax=Variovorax terrae TaxID=2923278 RepID=A0A9X2AS53_9BURK|nr:branched-chain amino acid ABC transporter ATP-binding protein/permease [Variovorax terrae]MCJ0764901.1 branched-chain amino acid ABC transporter ATP-binding protein/permease [Variovorax terrae]